jgi:hypothetical protein
MTPLTRTRRRRALWAWLETRFNLTEVFSLVIAFGLFPGQLDTRRPFRGNSTPADPSGRR